MDNKDGTVDVSYLPTAIGEYDLNVTFDQKAVPGVPFKAKVTPKGGAYDLSAIRVEGLETGMSSLYPLIKAVVSISRPK